MRFGCSLSLVSANEIRKSAWTIGPGPGIGSGPVIVRWIIFLLSVILLSVCLSGKSLTLCLGFCTSCFILVTPLCFVFSLKSSCVSKLQFVLRWSACLAPHGRWLLFVFFPESVRSCSSCATLLLVCVLMSTWTVWRWARKKVCKTWCCWHLHGATSAHICFQCWAPSAVYVHIHFRKMMILQLMLPPPVQIWGSHGFKKYLRALGTKQR